VSKWQAEWIKIPDIPASAAPHFQQLPTSAQITNRYRLRHRHVALSQITMQTSVI
jgi:hypothetical protein